MPKPKKKNPISSLLDTSSLGSDIANWTNKPPIVRPSPGHQVNPYQTQPFGDQPEGYTPPTTPVNAPDFNVDKGLIAQDEKFKKQELYQSWTDKLNAENAKGKAEADQKEIADALKGQTKEYSQYGDINKMREMGAEAGRLAANGSDEVTTRREDKYTTNAVASALKGRNQGYNAANQSLSANMSNINQKASEAQRLAGASGQQAGGGQYGGVGAASRLMKATAADATTGQAFAQAGQMRADADNKMGQAYGQAADQVNYETKTVLNADGRKAAAMTGAMAGAHNAMGQAATNQDIEDGKGSRDQGLMDAINSGTIDIKDPNWQAKYRAAQKLKRGF